MTVGTEAKETGLERRPSSGKGMEGGGGGNSLRARVHDEEEDEYGEVGEVTPPPHSPPHEDLPSLGDIFSRQVGISIGVHQLKHS
jgi:hypothetical protein